jgi:dihydropteroate synthase
MGILNCTPDSFFDGEELLTNQLVAKAALMIEEGATIIDIGGQSSRPGAVRISPQEEWQRIGQVIMFVRKTFPDVFISCDTFYAEVAERSFDAGADIINDISFSTIDKNLLSVVARNKVPYILMHMQGTPQTMQHNPAYKDVVQEVFQFMLQALHQLHQIGIDDVVIDPGFGFGKRLEHNYRLLKHLTLFKTLGKPMIAGLSRKSMINRVLNTNPVDALNGTTALNMLALQQGTDILRVHDVKEAVQTIKLWNAFNSAS